MTSVGKDTKSKLTEPTDMVSIIYKGRNNKMKTTKSNTPSTMPRTEEELTIREFSRGELFILRWQFNTAGSFDKALAEAMSKADTKNLNAFAQGFPEEAEAMWKYKTERDWWDSVKNRYACWMGWAQ